MTAYGMALNVVKSYVNKYQFYTFNLLALRKFCFLLNAVTLDMMA